MPTYKKNFITGVIFRIDFEEKQIIFKDSIPEELDRSLLNIFTQKETRRTKNEEIMINSLNDSISRKSVEVKEFNYYGNEKKKRNAITENYYFTEYSQFISYADFFQSVKPVLDYLRIIQEGLKSKRIGFRYINQFSLEEAEPLNWSRYLNGKMIKNIEYLDDEYLLSRSFTTQEYIKNSNRVLVQHGIINPDFPGPVVKKHYVLDIDVSRSESHSPNDFEELIEEMHQIQEAIFENSITDDMRALLNA